MLSSFQHPRRRQRRALLLFADSPHADCQRRGWPAAFRSLLETNHLRFEASEAFDAHLFTTAGASRRSSSFEVHTQQGTSFGERLDNAIETLAQLRYEEIVIVGQDCPDLEPVDIRRAFKLLEKHRLVLGPDHRGGCYLIAIHASERVRLQGVEWQRNTDFRQICGRFVDERIVALPVKIDLDSIDDVWLLAASESPFRCVARALLESKADYVTFEGISAPPLLEEQRIHWQLPPPVTLASTMA